eukprot:GHVR01140495.1.p1 GENE.GHVR01140495.1~~GHVR01140495.1.p1  ORF type:complete len:222 (-),score=31.95 GHVR01140495.1:109-774(-)
MDPQKLSKGNFVDNFKVLHWLYDYVLQSGSAPGYSQLDIFTGSLIADNINVSRPPIGATGNRNPSQYLAQYSRSLRGDEVMLSHSHTHTHTDLESNIEGMTTSPVRHTSRSISITPDVMKKIIENTNELEGALLRRLEAHRKSTEAAIAVKEERNFYAKKLLRILKICNLHMDDQNVDGQIDGRESAPPSTRNTLANRLTRIVLRTPEDFVAASPVARGIM